MQPSSLTQQEREKLILLLAKHRDDLVRLHRRMDQRGWYTCEPCYQAVIAAHHALQSAVAAVANVNSGAGKR